MLEFHPAGSKGSGAWGGRGMDGGDGTGWVWYCAGEQAIGEVEIRVRPDGAG